MAEMDSLISQIESRIQGIYRLEVNPHFVHLEPEKTLDHRLLRLLPRYPGSCHKTVLLAAIPNELHLETALRWTGTIKDNLTESEAADLYLLLVDFQLEIARAQLIESDDLFCRKYVKSAFETPSDFLDRTILGSLPTFGSLASLHEPIRFALMQTAEEHPWLSDTFLDGWHRALTDYSGDPGALIDDLLSSTPDDV